MKFPSEVRGQRKRTQPVQDRQNENENVKIKKWYKQAWGVKTKRCETQVE